MTESYSYVTGYRDDAALRASFNRLTRGVYGFDFEGWYQAGGWGEDYIPCSLCYEGQIVANVSVNRMHLALDGRPLEAVQLGTVMTDPAHRGHGLSRALVERVLREWADYGELFYLFANDSVLDFYPKFGFRRMEEYPLECALPAPGGAVPPRRLDPANGDDDRLLRRLLRLSNPCAALKLADGEGLYRFYCEGPMREQLYYLPHLDALIFAATEGDTLFLHDVLCAESITLADVLAGFQPAPGLRRAVLGFTPLDPSGCTPGAPNEDDTLFMLPKGAALFEDRALLFPVLSHA